MNYSNTIFNQLLNFLPKYKFNQYVGQHEGDRYVKKMTSWNQFVILMYAQSTGKDSLREIETGFNTHGGCWHHLGVNSVAKSSLSYANNNRDYEIFEKLFYALLDQCKEVTVKNRFSFENPLYSLDSSVIRVSLGLFDWAQYTKTKGALKLHTLLDNKKGLPELINITDGRKGDLTAAKQIDLDKLGKGSILVFDRAYMDYDWWREIDEKEITFVSRSKKSQNIFVVGQHKDKKLEKNILSDEIVAFGSYGSLERYSKNLRRVRYWDEENEKEYEYLTNNFELEASQIAEIYKARWEIELFFKWIKQNLKIKTFLGTSKNAVMTQIWIAMIYYLLLFYIKFQTKFSKSLLELTRIIKEALMLRRNLIDLLSLSKESVRKLKVKEENRQLSFW